MIGSQLCGLAALHGRDTKASRPAPGPGTIPKIAAILDALAVPRQEGARLKDLAEDTGIARPTVHRILAELTAVGLVRSTAQRRYACGSKLYALGLAAPGPVLNADRIRHEAQRLSGICGDTVYVGVRHADGVTYVTRTSGTYPLRAYAIDPGDILPLSNTYCGLAILGTLPAAEQERELGQWRRRRSPEWVATSSVKHEAMMRRALADVAELGYAAGPNHVVPELSGLSLPVPVHDATGAALAAVSISAVHSRLSPERIQGTLPSMRETAERLAESIALP